MANEILRSGDLVRRLSNVFDPDSKMMCGVVCARYKDMDAKYGPYPELYAVVWNHEPNKIDMGYFRHGLQLVARNNRKY